MARKLRTPHCWLTLAVALGLLLLFVCQGLLFIRANGQTFDEAVHLTAGYSYLATGDFRLNPEHPPLIKELCALPLYLAYHLPFKPDPRFWDEARAGEDRAQWWISRDFLYGASVPADRLLNLGRLPNLVLGTLLIALIGWWAYRLWGASAALLGMALAAIEPNLIAHSSLITTDLGITLFTVLTLYLLWEYSGQPSYRLLVAAGLALGLALVSKFSCLLLVIILVAAVGAYVLSGGSFPLARRQTHEGQAKRPMQNAKCKLAIGNWQFRLPRVSGRAFLEAATVLLRIVCLGLLVILPFYDFQGFSTWTLGLRTQMNQQVTGKETFFLGAYGAGGWWNYFLVCLLLKTPLGSLLLVLAALGLYRSGKPLDRRAVAFVLLPPVLYLIALTRLRLNLGVRYALPVYPFLFVLASRLATLRFRRAWLAPVVLGLPLAWAGASSLGIAPHHLAYFNELAGGPEGGYRYLSNSNLDWGQDLRGLKAYMDREGLPMIYLSYYGTAPPAAYRIRYQELPGFGQLGEPATAILPEGLARQVLAISVVNLQGVHCADRNLYAWLAARRPVAKIGYSIFVYDLTGDADAHRHLADPLPPGRPSQTGRPGVAEGSN